MNYYILLGALFLFGAANGITDISMNTLVTEIEKKDKVKFMAASHGFFSLGVVLAAIGSFLIDPLSNPVLHMSISVLLVLIVNFKFRSQLISETTEVIEKEPFSFRIFKPLLLLGLISFVVMCSEGAIVDWSGLYLKEITLAPEALWGVGFFRVSSDHDTRSISR